MITAAWLVWANFSEQDWRSSKRLRKKDVPVHFMNLAETLNSKLGT